MKFSIIIPCYNVEKYIKKTIESVLKQEGNFEIIAIDDGSKDRTLEIISNLAKDNRKIRVYTQKNKGVSYTRNRGIQLSEGDYLLFLDGDDTIEKNLLKNAENTLKKNKGIEVYSYGFKIITKDKERIINNTKYNNQVFNSRNFLKKYLNFELRQHICSFIIKKCIVEKYNFSEKMITGEDIDFQLRILLKEDIKIYYTSSPYFNYIKRINSATTQKIFSRKTLINLEQLSDLKEEMLSKKIHEYNNYFIVRYFSLLKSIVNKKVSKKDLKEVEYTFNKYKDILNDFNFNFKKKEIMLYFLIKLYKINFRICYFFLKIVSKFI